MTLEERANAFKAAYEAAKTQFGIGLMPALIGAEVVQTTRGPEILPTLVLDIVAIKDWQEPAPVPAAEPLEPLEAPADVPDASLQPVPNGKVMDDSAH